MLKIRKVISLNNDQKLLITLHISMPWHGMLVLLPLLLSPIKIMLALASIKTSKRWAIWGIILNSVLFLFPFFWLIGGTLLSGV
ncbi:hypothetical protein C6W24_03595 [Bacillus atrophaeus]|nr:hypothetical protein [Bacillus atrophaeus]KAA6455246.1 hypothetical protein DX926_04215 [Bacillus atrophaeus]PRS03047.1 hypothetical protein C6W24_03595 [Bacillus atrophaeus]